MSDQLSLFDDYAPLRIPCYRHCVSEWCSLNCFLKRGYTRYKNQWVRDRYGNIIISEHKECDWTPSQERTDK